MSGDQWGFDPARSEEWALLEFARLREELAEEKRREAETRRRVFLQGRICERLAAGMTRTDAAIAVGLARSTVYRWMKEEPAFRQAVEDAERTRAPTLRRPRVRKSLKMGPAAREAILRRLIAGGTRAQAADAAGISRQTFYTWLKRFPDFRDAVLAAETSR
ncbi:MAG: helix-turn-helix domain-containing protein [Mycobacteriales bacterium]